MVINCWNTSILRHTPRKQSLPVE